MLCKELAGCGFFVFFLHIFSIHGWLNPQMQNPWIWREDSVCVCVCVCVCVYTYILHINTHIYKHTTLPHPCHVFLNSSSLGNLQLHPLTQSPPSGATLQNRVWTTHMSCPSLFHGRGNTHTQHSLWLLPWLLS